MTGKHFDLGFTCQAKGEDIFLQEVKRLARKYRISWLNVPKGRSAAFRKCVDEGRLKINVFLNTQLDGVSLENPSLLLLRSLKEKNCLVVEDADDVRIYADKALQLSYLKRAALPVPRYFVINGMKGNRYQDATSRHFTQGSTWLARPAMGMNHHPVVINTRAPIQQALVKAGCNPGRRMLIYKYYKPLTKGNRVLSFRIWYLFGHVVPCWYKHGDHLPAMLKPGDISSSLIARLVNLVTKISEITLLDWFVTDLVVTNGRKGERVIIQEPANALAGFGPGMKRLRSLPHEVIRIAANRIVEVAWRKAHNLPLADGTTINLLQ